MLCGIPYPIRSVVINRNEQLQICRQFHVSVLFPTDTEDYLKEPQLETAKQLDNDLERHRISANTQILSSELFYSL